MQTSITSGRSPAYILTTQSTGLIEIAEFFLIEFLEIYRICRALFLVILKNKITKNDILQIL